MPTIHLVMGYPAAGKSTIAQKIPGVYLSRDQVGGRVVDLIPKMQTALRDKTDVVLDNTFPTATSREPFISAARDWKATIICHHLRTSIEDAQMNACLRMIKRHGRLLDPDEIRKTDDPNIFPVAVIFRYRKEFEMPSMTEGFDEIEFVDFARRWPLEFQNSALFLDYDGTVRDTKSGAKYPTRPNDIRILPNRAEILRKHSGPIFGISNQSGVSTGAMSAEDVRTCFKKTNGLLDLDIPVLFCPHNPAPISCYCRKPLCGLFVQVCLEHKLQPDKCLMVGDQTTDKTFAKRCGMMFEHADSFFKVD